MTNVSKRAYVDIGTLITSSPEIRGGRPCLAGTGTSVQRIALMLNQGLRAEEIAAQLPHIEPKFIFAALAYYFANREAVDAQIEGDEREGERLGRENRRRKQPA